MTSRMPQPDIAVALIAEGADNALQATGAFDRIAPLPFDGSAEPGDLFLVDRSESCARPVRRLGRPESVHAVIEALALANGERPHDDAIVAEAARASDAGDQFDRVDLRDLPTFTIDGESTRDFDDAISARREHDGAIRVWVHVADVAAYVRPGTALDEEARRRATSVYLPTRTVPMLPEALSAGVCSLQPNVDRAAVTCEVLLRDGHVAARSFYRSTIRSIARLTYDHVDQIFLGRLEPGPTYKAALQAARQAALDRTAADEIDRGDALRFVIDQGEVVDVTRHREGESHVLIERLMVLANQQVAQFLADRGVPSLYRVHEETSDERLASVRSRLKSMGVTVRGGTLADCETAVVDHEVANGPSLALREVLMSARQAAAYSRELARHDGLDLAAYTHFTSPIRRYADLIVHRALLAEIGAEPVETMPRYVELPDLAEHLTARTLTSKRLERRAKSICWVSLLRYRMREQQLPRTCTGHVVGMSDAGCFVRVHGTDGLLGVRSLQGRPNPQKTMWNGRRKLSLGDSVRVRIRDLDPVRGQIKLALA